MGCQTAVHASIPMIGLQTPLFQVCPRDPQSGT